MTSRCGSLPASLLLLTRALPMTSSHSKDIVVKPELSSAVRGLTSEQEAKALYTSGRSVIQQALREELKSTLGMCMKIRK